MKFLIQNNIFTENELSKILDNLDYPFEFCGVVPFSHQLTGNIQGVDYIPYGSTALVEKAVKLGFRGVAYNKDFNYATQIRKGLPMLNSEIILADELLYSTAKYDPFLFVRPAKDLKLFKGGVFSRVEIEELLDDAIHNGGSSVTSSFDALEELIVSNPITILQEYRCFIVGRKLISSSQYKRRGLLDTDGKMPMGGYDFLLTLLQGWLPAETCVIDICLTHYGWKIVEINCINCSGFYNHNLKEVFKELYALYSGS